MQVQNEAYLVSIGVKQENMQKCLDAMQKYGEPVLILKNLSQFQEDMCALLDRRIFKYEMCGAKFHQEANRAWKYGVGATSDKERQERFEESMQDLRDRGIDVQIIGVNEDFC